MTGYAMLEPDDDGYHVSCPGCGATGWISVGGVMLLAAATGQQFPTVCGNCGLMFTVETPEFYDEEE